MTMRLTLRPIGNSTGLILPKKLLDKMGAAKGDVVTVIETPDGLAIKPYDEEFERQMKVAEKGMAKYRHTLGKLADS